MEVWVCRCGLVDISKCEKRKRISNYFACQEITQTELGGNFSSSICDAKRFVEATVPSLTAALEELGYAVTIQQKCKVCGSTTFCTCSGR